MVRKAALIFGTIILSVFLSDQVQAGPEPESIGTATVSGRASVGDITLSTGTTIFSGERLSTDDSGQILLQSRGIRFVLFSNTSARIFHDGDRTRVELERGRFEYSSSGSIGNLAIYALDVRFVPKTDEAVVGQVEIVSRCEVIGTSQRGTMDATSGKETKKIEETKTYRIRSEWGVSYQDSWKPVLSDYPEYDRQAEYHHSHSHIACAPAAEHRAPVMAAGASHFMLLTGIGVGTITTIVVIKTLESPDHP